MITRDSRQAPPVDRLFSPAERWGLRWRDMTPYFRPFLVPQPINLLRRLQQQTSGDDEQYRRRQRIALAIVWLGLFWAYPGFAGWLVALPVAVIIITMLLQQAAINRWVAARQAHECAERAFMNSQPEWGAVTALPSTRRLNVYGGTPDGWEALLTTFGASCLGSQGNHLTVIDLSELAVAGELCNLTTRWGGSVKVMSLPEDLAEFDVLTGLSAPEIRDILIEVLEGDEKGDTSVRSRALSDRVLGAVCDVLHPCVTLDRLLAALRAILGQEPVPPAEGGLLSPDEWLAAKGLFKDEARREARERVAALEGELYQFKGLGANMPSRGHQDHQLRCIALTSSGLRVGNDYLKRLLVQVLIRSFRSSTGRAPDSEVYVIVGADAIERRYLEQLSELSRRRGVRLIYLFSRLRQEAGELLGEGDSAAAFMRLGNPDQAKRAAEYIAKDYKFVLGQRTTSTNHAVTHTDTTTEGGGDQRNHFPHYGRSTTRNWNVSKSIAEGITTGTSETTTRVHEYAVEPKTLQQLSEMSIVLAQHDAAYGGTIVTFCDCNPDLLTLPRVSTEPLTEPSRP